jgi:tRNA/rRNA methyltransferase
VKPQEPGNIGSAARVMKNFGLSELYLVAPQCELSKEAFYMATHAVDLVENAKIVPTVQEAVADRTLVIGTTARIRSSGSFDIHTPREAAQQFSREGLAVLFGPERSGLSNEDLDLCQAYIRIPTSQFASMNLAQAVNLIAYEFFVSHYKEELPTGLSPAATKIEIDSMLETFIESMYVVGYADGEKEERTRHMYRHIFERARLTRREVAALHGMWRQVRWAMENPDKLVHHIEQSKKRTEVYLQIKEEKRLRSKAQKPEKGRKEKG